MLKTNPEITIEVELLAAILRGLGPDQLATYVELSAAVGYSIQDRPFPLFKARKVVERETGLRFSTVRGEGVKKLPADALAGIGAFARKRISRHARRQAERLTGLRYNDVSAPLQSRIDAERSLLAAISAVAGASHEPITQNTSTGPIVAARVFDLIRPARDDTRAA